jgi:hypothetical protein
VAMARRCITGAIFAAFAPRCIVRLTRPVPLD